MAAYYMGMGPDVAVKPFFPINNTQRNHQPFLLEKIDIPVYRTQRKIGDRRFQPVIHPLSAGVRQGGLDNFQNGVPLFAAFSLDTVHTLIIITIIINVKRFLSF
jgi:hypothetical protein